MYEWENKITAEQIKARIIDLQTELKRILNTTLKGNFAKQEDKEYWVKKSQKISSELFALEESIKPKRSNIK